MTWFRNMNPTLRGAAIILLVAAVITALSLQPTLYALMLLAQIAFFLAIAFFLFLVWRSRREEISMWPARSRAVLYGAVVVALVNLGARFFLPWPSGGLETLVFFFVLGACAYSVWRVWRAEHTYGY